MQALPAVDEYTRYLDGLKGYCNKVVDFKFTVGFRPGLSFADFLEGVQYSSTETDYAGFHATDPNWYEEGNYETGALEPNLFGQLERHFRSQGLLEDDQRLDPIIHYTHNPVGEQYRGIFNLRGVRRADMVIEVSGGEREDWGQFITCWLEDGFQPFDLNRNPKVLDSIKSLARETGKREITFDEHWEAYKQRIRQREKESKK